MRLLRNEKLDENVIEWYRRRTILDIYITTPRGTNLEKYGKYLETNGYCTYHDTVDGKIQASIERGKIPELIRLRKIKFVEMHPIFPKINKINI